MTFKEQQLHETELLIRSVNRRLESYGKRMYVPDYHKSNSCSVHIEQYKELENRVYSLLKSSDFVEYVNTNNRLSSQIKTGIVGSKGNYIQLSRSKENLELFITHKQDLQRIIDLTPTWQELLNQTELEAGHKLKRKEKLEMIYRMSTIKRVTNLEQFLGESDNVEVKDSKLSELLRPFRGAKKGGVRLKGQTVSQSDWDALMQYLRSNYFVTNNSDDNNSDNDDFADEFIDENGRLDFSIARG